jgi:nitrite reductase (NO-forming)
MPNVTLPEDTMTLNHCFNVRSLVLAAAMVTSLGLVNHANAQLLPWRFGQLTVSEPRKQVKIEAVDIAQDPHAIGEPVGKREPKHVTLDLESTEIEARLSDGSTFKYWTFNNKVPGPFVRVRVGDTVTVNLRNAANSTDIHSIDFHAVTGPGGGAGVTQVEPGESKSFTF